MDGNIKIKNLFDPAKNIYRTIEKVITYNVSQEERLKAEISEYVVTESIESQFERLLTKMQTAMEMGGENEIGVWVSGFYGSGKSSFTKYLGMALDERVKIDGIPFRQYLADRFHKSQTKALLNTVAKRFPAAVVFLDLASEMLTGATMEDVSTVLYYKVLQWAGYSRNLKVAAFERKLKKDGRYEEFKQKIYNELGVDWESVQNDPLVIDSFIPEIAHQMYPQLFKTPTSFSTETRDIVQFENERVREMIEIVRETSKKEYIIFIVDEVGQYVGSRPNLILNLDGLAKNLKNIGDGKVWIIGTAQQTLTEDDPKAALNSPELYKLKDRFPIQVDLESRDIKEICYRRLLGKSPEGESILGRLFDQFGQSLRHHTKLKNAKYYDSDFSKETFINLYPFLPAHFDILLHLLGALAKSTGGIGLRSAIKVIQDILIEGVDGQLPVAEKSVGWLATTVTLYDALERDIRRAYPSIYDSVEKVKIHFADSELDQDIAKTIAVMQILDNLPVTIDNVASLMHPRIDAPSQLDEVREAVKELLNHPKVPLGEQNGEYIFFSEKVNEIAIEQAQLPLRTADLRRIFNEALRDVFSPLPSTRLHGVRTVTSGLKVQNGLTLVSLAGEGEPIQTVVKLVEPNEYEEVRNQLVDESRQKSSQYFIYLIGRNMPKIDETVAEIFRCREICDRYRNDPDKDIKEYCNSQNDRATKLTVNLQYYLKQCLSKGSFIFRGQVTAVENLNQDVYEACKKYLDDVAPQVFDRYAEAPVRVETSVAEMFLRKGNLLAIDSKVDPLGLVQIQRGGAFIDTNHIALISIRDYLERNGMVEGKRLMEYFTNAPFGWSQDTLRYLIAVLLVAGEIKLKVSGREITVNGQQAIDALRTNNSFKTVGVALREERPSNEVLARAAERLTDLIGDLVLPLEEEISKAASKYLPHIQYRIASLKGILSTLELPGEDRVDSLNREIADILFTDASDAPQRLGGEESSLYNDLKWVEEVQQSFDQGLKETIQQLREYCREINSMPNSGIPGLLRENLADELNRVKQLLKKEDFYKHADDLNIMRTTIMARIRDAAQSMLEAQKDKVREVEQDLRRIPEWNELSQEEQNGALAQIETLIVDVPLNLQGLKQLISREFEINSYVQDLKKKIISLGQQRLRQRLEEVQAKAKIKGETKIKRSLRLPSTVTSASQLDTLIRQIQQLKDEMAIYSNVEIIIEIEG